MDFYGPFYGGPGGVGAFPLFPPHFSIPAALLNIELSLVAKIRSIPIPPPVTYTVRPLARR